MAASVLLSCGLNERILPKMVFIPESANVDSSFLLSAIIGQQLKVSQTKVFIVCMHHSFNHYNSAGVRIGYNLSQSVQRGRVIPLDILEQIASEENFLENLSLEKVFNLINEKIEQLASTEDVIVIVDDVSVLGLISEDESLIARFCKKLAQTVSNHTDKSSIILKMNCAEALPVVKNSIGDIAPLVLNVNCLESGRFKEVDGKIIIQKRIRKADKIFSDVEEKTILYKVNERNVKTFAKGEFGV